MDVVPHRMSGKKIPNNADINSFVSTHHPRPVVYAELYFLYFIFLTEFSSRAVCVTPASASMTVEKSTADFHTVFQLDTVLQYFLVKDGRGAVTSMIP